MLRGGETNAARAREKRVIVRPRELAGDIGWLVALVLLLPLAIPIGALAFLFILGQRAHAWSRSRMRPGFIG